MALQYTSITGNTAQTLIAKRNVENATTGKIDRTFNASGISYMSICNNHSTDSVSVDLYVYDSVLGSFSILNSAVIPSGVTLGLDSKESSFDNDSYELRIKLSAADGDVDVIIK